MTTAQLYGIGGGMYGVWGGEPPGGWCLFINCVLEMRNAGTKEDAEATKAQFEKEIAEDAVKYGPNKSKSSRSYKVIPFDHTREPIGVSCVPTKAQVEMLNIIHKNGTINVWGLPPQWRATIHVLSKNGWYRNNYTADGKEAKPRMVLTKIGLEVMNKANK